MKNKLLLIIVSFFILVSIGNVLAIGITPGRTTLNFEPGLQKKVQFSVINTENKDMSVVFMVRGELADYISLSQTYAEFTGSDTSKSFTYTVKLPSKIDKPGTHQVEIVALEMPKDIKEQGNFVGATVSVISQLHVNVPYPHKYAEAEINFVESDGKIVFFIPLNNKGKLDIVNARAVIDVYTSLNEKVATIESNTESLKSLERKELVAELDSSSLNPGKYLAVATVIYDDETLEVEKEFNIGGDALEILEIIVEDFELGGIAKFEALIENKLSDDLEEVYLNILVYNEEGEVMADFKSPTYDIPSLSKEEMIAYWDTAGVKAGTYDSKVILKYDGESRERNVQMKITDDSIEVIGLTGHVVVKRGDRFNFNNILIILVVFLVIVNIIWFVVVKRLLKKGKK